MLRRRVRDPKAMRAYERGTIYLALVLAGLVFRTIWLNGAGRIAQFIARLTGLDADQTQAILISGLRMLFGTAAAVLLVLVVRGLRRAATVRLRAWSMKAPDIRVQRLVVFTPERIRRVLQTIVKGLYYVAATVTAVVYVMFVLSVFPATAEFGALALGYVGTVLYQVGGEIVNYLPNLVYLTIIVILIRYGLKALRFFLEAVGREELRLPGFDSDWADPTYKLLRVVAVLFGVVISYPYLPGAQSEVFRGFSVFIGALVTFGSTTVIGNVISGVVLTYTGSFRVGDRVSIGSTLGDVVEKTLFVTRIRTIANEVVSIPNGVVMTGSVINYSRFSHNYGLVLTVRAGIGYDVDWRRVHELLLEAAKKTSGVTDRPPPTVWQISLDDYAVTYELRAATNRPTVAGRIRSDLNRNVLDGFHKAGVEIMTPAVRSHRDGTAIAIPEEYEPPVGTIPRIKLDLERTGEALQAGLRGGLRSNRTDTRGSQGESDS